MEKRILVIALILAACTFASLAQSVVITPKRELYRRPKPQVEFKRTFVVRRPIAKAASPALSRKITAAISPERVLDLNIRDEMREYQWLERADYKVIYNQKGLLTINLWMEGTAAYPDSVSKYVVVDIKKGVRLRPADVFNDLEGLAALVKSMQSEEVKRSIGEMKKDPNIGDSDPADLFSTADFTVADLNEFGVSATGVTFYYDYGFPHVLEALQPAGEFKLSWVRLKQFVRRDGLLAPFIR